MIRITVIVNPEFVVDPELMAVDLALRERARIFDQFGAESPQYIAADGRLLAAKEALRKVRDGEGR
jgi:hypothetical protein